MDIIILYFRQKGTVSGSEVYEMDAKDIDAVYEVKISAESGYANIIDYRDRAIMVNVFPDPELSQNERKEKMHEND